MKDLLDYIVRNLVTNPEAIEIQEDSQDGSINLLLSVDPKDMGLIIGKSGQTIHAIRKILTVRAIAENVRVNLQLSEPQDGEPETLANISEESIESTDTSEASEEEK